MSSVEQRPLAHAATTTAGHVPTPTDPNAYALTVPGSTEPWQSVVDSLVRTDEEISAFMREHSLWHDLVKFGGIFAVCFILYATLYVVRTALQPRAKK
jgi:hypothetical protein